MCAIAGDAKLNAAKISEIARENQFGAVLVLGFALVLKCLDYPAPRFSQRLCRQIP
jgi:hypothetical protein